MDCRTAYSRIKLGGKTGYGPCKIQVQNKYEYYTYKYKIDTNANANTNGFTAYIHIKLGYLFVGKPDVGPANKKVYLKRFVKMYSYTKT